MAGGPTSLALDYVKGIRRELIKDTQELIN
jgi:hypothetical protein